LEEARCFFRATPVTTVVGLQSINRMLGVSKETAAAAFIDSKNSKWKPQRPIVRARTLCIFAGVCCAAALYTEIKVVPVALVNFVTQVSRHASISKTTNPNGSITSTTFPQFHHDNYQLNYTSPLEEFPNYLNQPLPPPMVVLEQYKTWHSHEALLRDPHNRTFIIAHYQCPISSGNWLHYFTSAFLWGV
jgi:hypothetical protein